MKFYNSFGMNPRTVRMFMRERDITLPTQEIDLMKGENREAPYMQKNPAGQTPLLELDNGTYLSETAAICFYLDETHAKGGSTIVGTNPMERAETMMWLRRVENEICSPAVWGFYCAEGLELFKNRVHVMPQAAPDFKTRAQKGLKWLEPLMAGKTWICGNRFSLADIALFTYMDLLEPTGQKIDPAHKNLTAWYKRMKDRPSAAKSVIEAPNGLRG